MKIAIIAAEHGYSFINQAKALAIGFSQINIENKILRIESTTFPLQELSSYHPNIIISIGDWHDYELLVHGPQAAGYATIPWLVADGAGEKFIEHYNRLRCLLATSKHCRESFIKAGIRAEIVRVVPEAVDPNFWQPLPQQDLNSFLQLISITDPDITLPMKFDLIKLRERKVPILFTTGGYATGKGAQEVIAALATLDTSLPWVYVIKTWPSARSFRFSNEELMLADTHGLGERIRYIVGEFSSEFIRGLMTLCDIYVSPSRHEGFGLPLIEAQLCEKPVITIAATAAQETVIHGETGFLARPDATSADTRADITDLAHYLKKLLTDSVLREHMGRRGRERAAAQYSPAVIARNMLTTIEQTT